MRRTMQMVVVAMALAGGLLAAQWAVAETGPGHQAQGMSDRWDDPEPAMGGQVGQLAFQPPEGVGPPGPPRDGDDDRPRPPRRMMPGPGADGRQPPGGPDGMDPNRERMPGAGRGPGPDGMDRRPPPNHEGRPGAGHESGPSPWGVDMQGMQKKDPELFNLIKADAQLDRETHETAMQYRQATGDQRDTLKKQVEQAVEKQFDVRQQKRTLELKRVEEQLQRLRDKMSRREKARKELVEKRVAELLGMEKDVEF